MHILIVNPIVYTSESANIHKVDSIKDSMIYDLCLAFYEQGHSVTLFAAEPYKPRMQEEYPFEIVWCKCVFSKVFTPHRFPVLSGLKKYIKKNNDSIDLIISGEVFSFNSLLAYRAAKKKTIIWHELALYNRMFKKIPAKIWYYLIVPMFMKKAFVVPRSEEAKHFIKKHCANVSEYTVDHGVNLNKFTVSKDKKNHFIVCSQLIERKRIDGILEKFSSYLNKYDSSAGLYIVGSGELEEKLKEKATVLGCDSNVFFEGKMSHSQLMPILAEASALLINTVKDNSMISIVEAISVGTPVVTTDVPLNSEYIIKNSLGIAKPFWDEDDLHEVVLSSSIYVDNCIRYRQQLSTSYRVGQFLSFLKNGSVPQKK